MLWLFHADWFLYVLRSSLLFLFPLSLCLNSQVLGRSYTCKEIGFGWPFRMSYLVRWSFIVRLQMAWHYKSIRLIFYLKLTEVLDAEEEQAGKCSIPSFLILCILFFLFLLLTETNPALSTCFKIGLDILTPQCFLIPYSIIRSSSKKQVHNWREQDGP